jgi:hypothetical protein
MQNYIISGLTLAGNYITLHKIGTDDQPVDMLDHITLHKIGTDDQPVDMLAKPLPYDAFVKHRYSLLGWSTIIQLQKPVTRSSKRINNVRLKSKKAIRSRRNKKGNKGGIGH